MHQMPCTKTTHTTLLECSTLSNNERNTHTLTHWLALTIRITHSHTYDRLCLPLWADCCLLASHHCVIGNELNVYCTHCTVSKIATLLTKKQQHYSQSFLVNLKKNTRYWFEFECFEKQHSFANDSSMHSFQISMHVNCFFHFKCTFSMFCKHFEPKFTIRNRCVCCQWVISLPTTNAVQSKILRICLHIQLNRHWIRKQNSGRDTRLKFTWRFHHLCKQFSEMCLAKQREIFQLIA